MRAVIIDNEANIVAALKQLIQLYCTEVEVIGTASTVAESLQMLPQMRPDLVFLDVELDDGTGMEILSQVGTIPFQVIFVTAYDKYAVEAFRHSAIDYLLKPVDPDDLVVAVHKAFGRIQQKDYDLRLRILEKNLASITGAHQKIIVSDKQHVHAFSIDEIYCLQAEGAYTHFHLKNKSILASRHLKHYEQILNDKGFERAHHSYLVNLAHMSQFQKNDSTLLMDNGLKIPVSSRKRDQLLTTLRRIGLGI